MKKNDYKKKDANGNKLPEQIGKGFNKDYNEKLTQEVKARVSPRIKKLVTDFTKNGNESDFLRLVLERFFKDEIEPTKLEFIVQELTLKGERIAQLEHFLEQLKSQLLDTYAADSVIITCINNQLNK